MRLKEKATLDTSGRDQVPQLTYNDVPWTDRRQSEAFLEYRIRRCAHYATKYANDSSKYKGKLSKIGFLTPSTAEFSSNF